MGFFSNFISQRVSKVIENRIKKNLLTKQEINSANEEIKNILIEADVDEKVISVLIKNISKEYERTFRPEENVNHFFLKV
jgi:signal recognition particle GTPase